MPLSISARTIKVSPGLMPKTHLNGPSVFSLWVFHDSTSSLKYDLYEKYNTQSVPR